jgi:hypothetical protein
LQCAVAHVFEQGYGVERLGIVMQLRQLAPGVHVDGRANVVAA